MIFRKHLIFLLFFLHIVLVTGAQTFTLQDTSFERGQVLTTRNISFLSNKAVFAESARPFLDSLVTFLQHHQNLHVEIGNHKFSTGSEAYGLCLTCKRAQSVRDYLIDHGVNASRIEARGYGESQPLYPAEDVHYRWNQRTAIKITSVAGDFDFLFEFGYDDNKVDSRSDSLVKQISYTETTSTLLRFSKAELDTIYLKVQQINLFDYPAGLYKPRQDSTTNAIMQQSPCETWGIQVFDNGRASSLVRWTNCTIARSPRDPRHDQLMELKSLIEKMIYRSDAWKSLPSSRIIHR